MKMAKQLILANNYPLGKLLKKLFRLKQQINVQARSGRTVGRTDARTNTEQSPWRLYRAHRKGARLKYSNNKWWVIPPWYGHWFSYWGHLNMNRIIGKYLF